jgi:hypothetical protein
MTELKVLNFYITYVFQYYYRYFVYFPFEV